MKHFSLFFYLLILFLPTQLGRHFWPNFSFVSGIRIDYLSPTLYATDIFILLIFVFWLFGVCHRERIPQGRISLRLFRRSSPSSWGFTMTRFLRKKRLIVFA